MVAHARFVCIHCSSRLVKYCSNKYRCGIGECSNKYPCRRQDPRCRRGQCAYIAMRCLEELYQGIAKSEKRLAKFMTHTGMSGGALYTTKKRFHSTTMFNSSRTFNSTKIFNVTPYTRSGGQGIFDRVDTNDTGFITREQNDAILKQSGLPTADLHTIFNLATENGPERKLLDRHDLMVCQVLIQHRLANNQLPDTLPWSLRKRVVAICPGPRQLLPHERVVGTGSLSLVGGGPSLAGTPPLPSMQRVASPAMQRAASPSSPTAPLYAESSTALLFELPAVCTRACVAAGMCAGHFVDTLDVDMLCTACVCGN